MCFYNVFLKAKRLKATKLVWGFYITNFVSLVVFKQPLQNSQNDMPLKILNYIQKEQYACITPVDYLLLTWFNLFCFQVLKGVEKLIYLMNISEKY